jgi:hypothetical protein
MRKPALVLTLSLAAALGACQKTGEGEYQVKTPDVNVSTDTATVRTPTVDVKTEPETVITNVPKVDVQTPAERAGTKTP